MIPEVDKIIIAFAEETVRRLQESVGPTLGPSIFYRYDGKRLLIGSEHAWITVLEDGRPPGKWPPRDAITPWAERRGLNPFLVQRAIGEKGTLLWQSGGNSGVLSNILNEEYIRKNLLEPLRAQMLKTVVNTLLK